MDDQGAAVGKHPNRVANGLHRVAPRLGPGLTDEMMENGREDREVEPSSESRSDLRVDGRAEHWLAFDQVTSLVEAVLAHVERGEGRDRGLVGKEGERVADPAAEVDQRRVRIGMPTKV